MKLTTYLSAILFSVILSFNLQARTCNCIVDGGDWGTPTTWDCPGGPQAGDTVNIPAGITVNVNNVYTYTGDAMYINVDGTLHLGKPGSKLYLPCGSIVHFSATGRLTKGLRAVKGNAREIHICDALWWDDDDGIIFGIVTWGVITPLNRSTYQFHISESNGKPTLNLFIDDESMANEIKIYKALNSNEFQEIERLKSNKTISYTDQNLTSGTSYYKIALVSKTGIQETITLSYEKKETASFFPNPARDILNVNIENEREFKSLKIFSITGELVHQSTNKIEKLNVSDWESGVYLIQIEHENNVVTNRLVVQ